MRPQRQGCTAEDIGPRRCQGPAPCEGLFPFLIHCQCLQLLNYPDTADPSSIEPLLTGEFTWRSRWRRVRGITRTTSLPHSNHSQESIHHPTANHPLWLQREVRRLGVSFSLAGDFHACRLASNMAVVSWWAGPYFPLAVSPPVRQIGLTS